MSQDRSRGRNTVTGGVNKRRVNDANRNLKGSKRNRVALKGKSSRKSGRSESHKAR